MKVYPLRIAPILTIFTQNESSWRDLSFETHFVFRWFFSRRAVDGCSVDGRRMIFGRPFSHDKIRWISKIQISNFKFQLTRAGTRPRRSVRPSRPAPTLANWNLKFEIWNLKFEISRGKKRLFCLPRLISNGGVNLFGMRITISQNVHDM